MGKTSSSRTLRPALTGVLALLLAASGSGRAAGQQAPSRDALWSLLSLPGKHVSVRYTPGSLDRATRVQQRLEPLAAEVGSWLRDPAPLAAFVVSREEWNQLGLALPYGFPARLPGRLLMLPAFGDEGTAEFWGGKLGMSLPASDPGFGSGPAAALSSLEVCDLVGSVEATRILLEKAGISGEEVWISELMTHTAYLAARWQGRRPVTDEEVRGATASREAGPLALKAYTSGLSMEDWLWFQSAFYRGALELIDRRGDRVARQLVRRASKSGGELGRGDLLDRYPELREWLRAEFAAAP
jgi:hypothetical protein